MIDSNATEIRSDAKNFCLHVHTLNSEGNSILSVDEHEEECQYNY